ncbi:hypothetical protein BH09BAC6_BH09BAC6_06760 [soil metagenome]|jgi:hypothetical protein
MKKLQLFILLTITTITGAVVSAFAQTAPETNQQISIDAKGGIHNHKGTKIGFIDKNDIVRSNTGKELYFIDKKGNVIAADGRKLGMAKKNGSYYDNNGMNMLNTKDIDKEKCAILDPQGHNFGTAHKNYKLHACAAHCFFLEQAKKKAEKKP